MGQELSGRRTPLFRTTNDSAVGSSRALQVHEHSGAVGGGWWHADDLAVPKGFQQLNINCNYPREGGGFFLFYLALFQCYTFCQQAIQISPQGLGESTYK